MHKEPGTLATDTENCAQLHMAWHNLLRALVHHLNTSLIVIRAENKRIEEILPELFQARNLALEHELLETHLDQHHLKANPLAVEQQVAQGLDFLSALHSYNQSLLADTTTPHYSVLGFIQDYLASYPWQAGQQQQLYLDNHPDFPTQCEPSFMQALLHNLLLLGFYHIRSGGSGTIHIWAQAEEHYNSLNFKIETNIMYMDSLKRAFNNFFAIHEAKTIPGLGFCRLKWLSMGGNILSEIEAGKYAHFVVEFPKLMSQEI